jgi:hypothetical protein
MEKLKQRLDKQAEAIRTIKNDIAFLSRLILKIKEKK